MKPIIIPTYKQLCRWVEEYVWKNKPKSCWISTYGIWIGMTRNGKLTPWDNETRHMLHSIIKSETRLNIRIGLPYFAPCREGCEHCLDKIDGKIDAINHTAAYLAKHGAKAVVSKNVHSKGIAFSDGLVIVGGMNLTGSSFEDMAMITRSKSVMEHIKRGVLK